MDIKNLIDTVMEKVSENDDVKDRFMKNPIETVEALLGMDLPDEQINGVVEAIKAKLGADVVGDAVDKLKNLF